MNKSKALNRHFIWVNPESWLLIQVSDCPLYIELTLIHNKKRGYVPTDTSSLSYQYI